MNIFPDTYVKENEKINIIITIAKLSNMEYEISSYMKDGLVLDIYTDGESYGEIIFFSDSKKLFVSKDCGNIVAQTYENYIKLLDDFLKSLMEVI